MAGNDPDFWPEGSGDEFKADIRAVQLMAMPNTQSKRPTFYFDQHLSFASPDSAGQPFDLHTVAPVGSAPRPPVQVLCTVEPMVGLGAGSSTDETATGSFAGHRAKLYFFTEEWAQIDGFATVKIDDIEYTPVRRHPTNALFDVDIHCMEVKAPDA